MSVPILFLWCQSEMTPPHNGRASRRARIFESDRSFSTNSWSHHPLLTKRDRELFSTFTWLMVTIMINILGSGRYYLGGDFHVSLREDFQVSGKRKSIDLPVGSSSDCEIWRCKSFSPCRRRSNKSLLSMPLVNCFTIFIFFCLIVQIDYSTWKNGTRSFDDDLITWNAITLLTADMDH